MTPIQNAPSSSTRSLVISHRTRYLGRVEKWEVSESMNAITVAIL